MVHVPGIFVHDAGKEFKQIEMLLNIKLYCYADEMLQETVIMWLTGDLVPSALGYTNIP